LKGVVAEWTKNELAKKTEIQLRYHCIDSTAEIDTVAKIIQLGADAVTWTTGFTAAEECSTIQVVGVDGEHVDLLQAHDGRTGTFHGAPGVVGGGYIGLEAAAALKKLGMKVTVLEAMDRVLQRITTQEISGFYTRVHNEEGVNIEVNAVAASIEGTGQVEKVICQDGRAFDADLIIAGIGIIPCDELAQQAGLDVDNGILVDEFSQTSDSKILAAGDCTVHYNPIYDRHIRLESVQNAVDQAMVAAATNCGSPLVYKALPWFWSDQYDIKLQIAGLSQGYDQVVMRGDINTGRSFAAFYLKQGKLLAVDAINKPKEFMMGRRLIMRGNTVDPAKLADEQLPMKDLI
jgi:3-phenylpropionate/trans-cinnamate dioxygenase ferredoxin reductase subunit